MPSTAIRATCHVSFGWEFPVHCFPLVFVARDTACIGVFHGYLLLDHDHVFLGAQKWASISITTCEEQKTTKAKAEDRNQKNNSLFLSRLLFCSGEAKVNFQTQAWLIANAAVPLYHVPFRTPLLTRRFNVAYGVGKAGVDRLVKDMAVGERKSRVQPLFF